MVISDGSALSSPLTSVPSSPYDRPSSPLSYFSRSPSPPAWARPPSPPPSQDAGDNMGRSRKRRKIDVDRTTRHLDLTEDAAQSDYDRKEAAEVLMHALRNRKKIVVFAGAGISVAAGIPDFRSSNGLFAGLQKEHKLKGGSGRQLFDAAVYKDPELTSQFHDMVRNLSEKCKKAQPTPFHHMLARLSAEGRLLRLYTQNIDGLDTQMEPLATEVPLPHKGPWPQTIQLHGGLDKMNCQKCQGIFELDASLFEGSETPTCHKCRETDDFRTNDLGRRSHGIGRLRPRFTLYHEQDPDGEAIGAATAADMRTRPDAVVVVGTSMKIKSVCKNVSEMCKIVRGRREGTTIWINPDPEPKGLQFEDCWDLIVKGESDQVATLVKLRQWDDENMEAYDLPTEYTDSDVERVMARQGELKINLPPSPPKRPVVAVMTPPRSQAGDSQAGSQPKSQKTPIRIMLKVGEKSASAEAENKKRQLNSVQVMVPTLPKTKNAASTSKKLSDVLGRNHVQNNAKSKTSKKMSKSRVAGVPLQQVKIEAKVTKTARTSSTVDVPMPTKPMPKSLFSNKDKQEELRSDYRSWAKDYQSSSKSTTMSNDLVTHGLFAPQAFSKIEIDLPTPAMISGDTTPQDTPGPQTPPNVSSSSSGRLQSHPKYDRKQTVSPPSVPRGMANLLH